MKENLCFSKNGSNPNLNHKFHLYFVVMGFEFRDLRNQFNIQATYNHFSDLFVFYFRYNFERECMTSTQMKSLNMHIWTGRDGYSISKTFANFVSSVHHMHLQYLILILSWLQWIQHRNLQRNFNIMCSGGTFSPFGQKVFHRGLKDAAVTHHLRLAQENTQVDNSN